MSLSLEERLKNNSSAFDGLLSLIPAKYYYDDDTQEQWKAKKQTKEEANQNKRAKLDPTQSKESEKAGTAADVLKKRSKTAKPVVIPGQKKQPAPVVESETADETEASEENGATEQEHVVAAKAQPKQNNKAKARYTLEADESEEEINLIFDDEGNEVQHESTPASESTTAPSKSLGKKKAKNLSEEEKKKKEESVKALKEKLASKINIMKEKRKAPGSKAAGAPSSREAILEERRKKAEVRAEKKRKLKDMQDGGSDSSDDDEEEDEDSDDDADETKDDGVIYQNIVFDDKTRATSDLQNVRTDRNKGPAKKDFRAHLKVIEQKKQKLENMDENKKKQVAENEKWNRTFAAAEGQKLRDDEKMLKKALKRKETQKRKSEVEWRDRKDHVEKMISGKAKRREENLAIRKANKGVKRKQQTKQMRKFKSSISPKRAGFEGRRSSKKPST